jgi:hypothetical protein
MVKSSKKGQLVKRDQDSRSYSAVLDEITEILQSARRTTARAVNTVMTTVYWEVGRRVVEYEQKGATRAAYGEKLLERLSTDLGKRFGRGFGLINLRQMRRFYLEWPDPQIRQTVSDESQNTQRVGHALFPLPWSHYVKLLALKKSEARAFYETEALRGGWSVRQLERQINSQFYERTALSRNKAAMLKKGSRPLPQDAVTPEEEIKDPFVLEFLSLKDEYSESDLEEALIKQLAIMKRGFATTDENKVANGINNLALIS